MKRLLGLSLLLSTSTFAATDGPVALKAADQGVGRLIRDASFTDLDGKAGRLSDFARYDALVVALNQPGCPISKKYSATLNSLERAYRSRNVAFLFVNVDKTATVDELREWAKDRGYEARYAADLDLDLAKALYGKTSTETFVLDRARTLKYRGAVDDQYGLTYSLPQPKTHLLKNALEAVLDGKTVAEPAYSAPGCLVKIPAEPVDTGEPTYHARLSRILQANCQSCHRPGENGPFPLLTYKDAVSHAAMMDLTVSTNRMPPWSANPKYGHWANDRTLNPQDKDALLRWIQGDQLEGDPKDAPLPIAWTNGWKMGPPDAVIQVPAPLQVSATGTMPYQYVHVLNPFPDDKWIEAVEIRVTAPQVVHHVLVLEQEAGQPIGSNPGLDNFFAAYVPGTSVAQFPANTGRLLKKGSRLWFQIHYTPNGTATEDQPKVGIRFAKTKPQYEMLAGAAYDAKFKIPAHDPNYQVVAEKDFPQRARLFSFMPHMHLRGKAFRYELLYPDGKVEILLDVPRYDFNWQILYELKQPIDVPAGTKLRATAWFDNSAQNPANPDPSKPVTFGEQTYEEMMIGYFNWHAL